MIFLSDILSFIRDYDFALIGNTEEFGYKGINNICSAKKGDISWLKGDDEQKEVSKTNASMIIINHVPDISDDILKEKTFIITRNPKLLFTVISNKFFVKNKKYYRTKLAYVDDGANIQEEVEIQPFCTIGACRIEIGSRIQSNTYIHDNVMIGRNVLVEPGCVIGAMGSGYAKNEDGEWIRFPHIKNVIIKDNVEIGANTYINRGALEDTVIGEGTKIGNSVCIGHNVKIGKNCMIVANTVIAGSTIIGDNVYIAHGVVIRNDIKIGNNAIIGMGSVVTKDVPGGSTVYGNPAK